MVCIAAFVILALVVLCIPIIRIFSKKTADSIWALFKKSTYCVSRRATFRKCDSTFKDDVKNSILRKVVLKHPKWIKPLSAVIETAAVLIVIISIWSLLVAAKSGLSLFVYGTCDVAQPSACSLSGEACSIDSAPVDFWQNPLKWTGNWFAEFGDIIANIPTRLRHWDADDYIPKNARPYHEFAWKTNALDIVDPGCVVCQKSFKNQLKSGFFDKYNVAVIPYPIKDPDGGYKFANSYLITTYIEAARLKQLADRPIEWLIIEKLFTENDESDPKKRDYQSMFNVSYDENKARVVLESWLEDFGYSKSEITEIAALAKSDQVKKIIDKTYDIMDNKIKGKRIPTIIYDGKRHDGLFE
ncbi:hypothetical protein FWF74_01705 [Candidatus Saccharibacteria bacterium]|nr:hypothetical protein [Candidatus Saccharibacteria bacterium]MCL1963391.1 hypothetical protein [Candidatus Saccharibacteria bacterium]